MSTTRTPTPASIAPVIGTHLARAHRTTQHLTPAPVVLWAARQTGTYAWTLVDHRDPATTPAVLLSHTHLAPTSPEVVAQTLAGLHPLLAALARETPPGSRLTFICRGPDPALRSLGPLASASEHIWRTSDTALAPAAAHLARTHTKKLIAAAAPEPTDGTVTVATDGSLGHRHRGAGAAWVTSDRRFGARYLPKVHTVLAAELTAIADALDHLPPGTTSATVRTDSQDAIHAITAATAGEDVLDCTALPSDAIRAMRIIAGHTRSLDLQLVWTKAHATDPLNNCADRLAVAARRSGEAHLAAHDTHALARKIVDQTLTAA